jgi:hypothetical protein
MPDEPDLTAELDEAEALVLHDVTTVTEWGYRFPDGHVHYCAAGGEGEARYVASRAADAVAVRRTVTYGPWELVTDA